MEILNPLKILVIQTAFIGDAILTLPMIQELKKKNSNCIIDVVATPASAEIFENTDCVNKVFIFDKRGSDKSFTALLRLAKKIRIEKYEQIYSPHRSFRTALLVLFSDVKETYGFSNSSFRFVYKNIVKYEHTVHEVKRNLALAGINTKDDRWKILPELNISHEVQKNINKYLNIRSPFVALAPGAVWETKKYPGQYYKEIINYLLGQGFTVLLIGGRADKEYCRGISDSFPGGNVINTAGEFSITESVEIIKHCELLICNDSAPTHFGMCANIPVLTIYCSTVPEFGFYPYNERSEIINVSDLECKPCGIHGHKACPLGSFVCAHNINISQIKNVINKILFNE